MFYPSVQDRRGPGTDLRGPSRPARNSFSPPRRPLFLRGAALLVLLGSVLSCRTPPPPPVLKHPAEALPPGKDLYFSVSPGANREFLRRVLRENGLSSRGSEYLITNSRFFFGAASFRPGSLPEVSLIAEGGFSGALVEFGIGREPGWEKTETTIGRVRVRSYREVDGPGRVAVPSDNLLVFSTGEIEECLFRLYEPRGIVLPPEILSRFEESAAAAYLPGERPGVLPGTFMETFGLPAIWKTLLVTAERREHSRFAFGGTLELAEGRDGRAPAVLLRLLLSGRLAAMGRTLREIRETLRVEGRENIVHLSGFVLSEDETAEIIRGYLKNFGSGKK